MYDVSDLRAKLSRESSQSRFDRPFKPADYIKFYEVASQIEVPGRRTWLARGENAIVGYSELEPGGEFVRSDQRDEWALLIVDHDTRVRLRTEYGEQEVGGNSITFIPPGRCELNFPQGGVAVTIFTARAADLAAQCLNAANYSERNSVVPPHVSWPVPPDGFRIRSYSLDVRTGPLRAHLALHDVDDQLSAEADRAS